MEEWRKSSAEAADLHHGKAAPSREQISDETKKDWLLVERKLAGLPLWSKPLVDLTVDDLRTARASLFKTNHRSASNGGQTSAAKVLRYLRAAIKEAIGASFKGTIPNPFDHVGAKFWPKPKRQTRIVDKEQLPRWWAAVGELRASNQESARTIGDFLLIELLTGARKSELLKLEWRNVDFERGVITFPAPDTKARREHAFPMTTFVKRVLMARRKENEARAQRLPWVFPSTRRRAKADVVSYLREPKKQIAKVVEAAGVAFSPHDLRRSFATNLNSGALNANGFQIKMALNHAHGDVTMGYMQDKVETLRPIFEHHERIILERVKATATRRAR
jgi:integrase